MIDVYTYDSAAGQRKDGVQYGPATIIQHLKELGYEMHITSPVEVRGPRIPHKLNYATVNTDCKKLYDAILNPSGSEPRGKLLFLGGDHSMSIATISAMLEKYPDLFVIWIDAHPDISNKRNYS